jgi:hypothetical protein
MTIGGLCLLALAGCKSINRREPVASRMPDVSAANPAARESAERTAPEVSATQPASHDSLPLGRAAHAQFMADPSSYRPLPYYFGSTGASSSGYGTSSGAPSPGRRC